MDLVFGNVVVWVRHVLTPSRKKQKGEKNQIPCKTKIQCGNRRKSILENKEVALSPLKRTLCGDFPTP